MATAQTRSIAQAPTRVEDPRGLAVVEERALQCSLQWVAGPPHVWLAVVGLQVIMIKMFAAGVLWQAPV